MVGPGDRPAMVAHHPDAEHPAFVPELHTAQQHLQHLPLFAKVSCTIQAGSHYSVGELDTNAIHLATDAQNDCVGRGGA